MPTDTKIWLVRTRSGELLGPYSQRELFQELHRNSFSASDEIAPSAGFWISAQTLLNRDRDEFTQTSTRNTAVTQGTASQTGTPVPSLQTTFINEEIALTPEHSISMSLESPIKRSASLPQNKQLNSKFLPILGGIAVIVGLWFLVSYLKPQDKKDTPSIAKSSPITQSAYQSPFVSEIYQLIHSGQTATALKKLTEYHEKTASATDLDYLIPYAALLITEGESSSHARKYLEKVLVSSSNLELKAQAHHWLGYLMLSQEERDMGENHFLESLQLNPKDAAARFNLGRAYLKQEKYRPALDYLQLAELEVPDLWLVHILKGRAKAALGLIDEAGSSFRKAISLSKDRWICYVYYALFLHKQGKESEAREQMKLMLTRDPTYELNSPPPLGFYIEKVNYAEYLNAFILITKGTSGEDKELGKLYISYLLNGPNSEEAKRIEAVANKGSLTSKILALKVALDRDANSNELTAALDRLPRHLSEFGYYAYVLRGETYLRLDQFEESRNDFQRALTLEPQSAISHWAFATLLHKMSQRAQAKEQIETLLTYHPNYIPAIVSSQNF